jgi:hypothetical protein
MERHSYHSTFYGTPVGEGTRGALNEPDRGLDIESHNNNLNKLTYTDRSFVPPSPKDCGEYDDTCHESKENWSLDGRGGNPHDTIVVFQYYVTHSLHLGASLCASRELADTVVLERSKAKAEIGN